MNTQNRKKIQPLKMLRKFKKSIILLFFVVVLVLLFFFVYSYKDNEKEVITETTLEKMLDVSELSTVETVYNGVTQVMNKKDKERVDYYVYYEAKIKAGFDFEQIKIELDQKAKKISITLPEIQINDINVDIGSLEYIFENKRADTQTVSQEAYEAAIQDVTEESAAETAIFDVAKQNAENIIEALIRPFVQQVDANYQIEIQ